MILKLFLQTYMDARDNADVHQVNQNGIYYVEPRSTVDAVNEIELPRRNLLTTVSLSLSKMKASYPKTALSAF